MHSSSTEASKLGEANWSTRLSLSTSNSATSAAAKLAMPSWVTMTPLGRPVDPEV
jgi:hypothetical protein